MRSARHSPAKKRAKTPTKKLRRPGLLGWLRDVAGNATTETVIMIPIFVVIWGGIAYTHQRYRKAINEGQLARAHVWQHAFAACEGGPPSGNTRIGESSDDSSGFISGVVDLLLTIAPGFSIDEIRGERQDTVDRPAVLGEGSVNIEHSLTVMCNEPDRGDPTLWDAAWGLFF